MRILRGSIHTLAALTLALLLSLAGTASTLNAAAQKHQRDPATQNERLAKQVRHELLMLPYYSVFDNLEYRVDGDRVTLSGLVVRPTLKSDAENVVKRIEGVATVTNKIEVLPLSTFDDRIRLAEYRAIYGAAQLNRYALNPNPPIHIIVKNGHVTLVGVVDNEGDRNVAYIRASAVPDVFSVTNRLVVARG
jgi:hyperosmotically inducible protein